MTIEKQNSAPSNLIDVIGQCKEALDAMGIADPVMIGKQYMSKSGAMPIGSAPRIVFVPEFGGGGAISAPREMGNAASMIHSCTVYVRGRESGTDLERFAEAYAIGDLAIDLIKTAAPGRIEWAGEMGDSSPTDSDAYGAEVKFTFLYRRDVQHSAARWGLARPLSDLAAQHPQPPPGIPAGGIRVIPSTDPQEPS